MIGAIAAGAQAVLGVGQMIGGLTMPKPDIPDYEIPDELYKNMTDAEYWSFMGLPDAQKQQFVEQSSRAGATALASSTSRKGGLGMVSSIAQQERDSATQMLSMDADARMRNLQNFWGAREKIAGAKDVEFGHDLDKVMYEREKRDEMIGAGMQNIAGMAGTIGGLAAEGLFGSKKKLPAVKSVSASENIRLGRSEVEAETNLKGAMANLTW